MHPFTLPEEAKSLGLALAPAQIDQFEQLATELIDWNQRFNLTAIKEPDEIVHKHFLDSLSLLQACDLRDGERVIDVGSGAGFPGLPLKIARPDLRLTLLEATRKKCEFLQHIVAHLGLKQVSIIHARAEDVGHDVAHRQQYDTALARAVAEMVVLAEYMLPLVRVGGRAVAQKSGQVQAEVERASLAIETLGGRVQRITPIDVPRLNETRYVVLIEKIASTPDIYPRRAGRPKKKPIIK